MDCRSFDCVCHVACCVRQLVCGRVSDIVTHPHLNIQRIKFYPNGLFNMQVWTNNGSHEPFNLLSGPDHEKAERVKVQLEQLILDILEVYQREKEARTKIYSVSCQTVAPFFVVVRFGDEDMTERHFHLGDLREQETAQRIKSRLTSQMLLDPLLDIVNV